MSQSQPDLFELIDLAIRVMKTPSEKVDTIAFMLVGDSCRAVLGKMGPHLLEVSAHPELTHTVGKLVAKRAVRMAKDYVAMGSPRRGHLRRLSVNNIINSIGQMGIEVEISSTGEISTTVDFPTTRYRQNRTEKAAAEAIDTDLESVEEVVAPAGSDDSNDDTSTQIEVGHKEVFKRKDGTTTIIIESLNVYMTILNVEDMVVDAKQVNYHVARHGKDIQAAIEAKEPDRVIDETEDEK